MGGGTIRRHQGQLVLKPRPAKAAPPTPLKWQAAWDQRVTAIILVGDTVFTGSRDMVRATAAADGKALWSAPVKGTVTDLAFNGGRLFVTTDPGAVACFAPAKR